MSSIFRKKVLKYLYEFCDIFKRVVKREQLITDSFSGGDRIFATSNLEVGKRTGRADGVGNRGVRAVFWRYGRRNVGVRPLLLILKEVTYGL